MTVLSTELFIILYVTCILSLDSIRWLISSNLPLAQSRGQLTLALVWCMANVCFVCIAQHNYENICYENSNCAESLISIVMI